MLKEFKAAHSAYQRLLNDDDRDDDTDNWFQPKIASVNEFNGHVNNWLSNSPEMIDNDNDDDAEDNEDVTNENNAKVVVDVAPHESASQILIGA